MALHSSGSDNTLSREREELEETALELINISMQEKRMKMYLAMLELLNTLWELHRLSKKKYASVNSQVDY